MATLFDNVILQLRVGYDTLLLVLESAHSAMVADPVLRVLAELGHFKLVVSVDRGTAVVGEALHLFELLGADKDLLLGHFNDAAVEVLEEKAVLL